MLTAVSLVSFLRLLSVVCSPLSRLLSRFRKDKPVTHEAVTPEALEEPKEEPDDESRPEGQALRGEFSL